MRFLNVSKTLTFKRNLSTTACFASRHWKPQKHSLFQTDPACQLSPDSLAVSAKYKIPYPDVEPLVTPIYHSSTYRTTSVEQYLNTLQKGGYIYSRLGSPTCEAAEVAICALEGGAGSLVFSTGMAAIYTSLIAFLKAGDHVIANFPLFSATQTILDQMLTKYKVEVTWVSSMAGIEEYERHIKSSTRVLFAETPSNPLLTVLDLEKLGALGYKTGTVTMVDSTCASPYLQQPIKHGVDLSIHSCTKYLGGHGDIMAGVVTTKTEEQWKEVLSIRSNIGNNLSPFEASLLLRGIKTLHLRMARHSENAHRIAEFLQNHPKISKVYYPGLTSHPDHEIAKKQMAKFSGMITFELKDGLEAAKHLVQNVKLIQFAVSLGSVESLIQHPASMTHGPMLMTDEERARGCITDGLIRFSVGIEDPNDLINDLEQALEKA